MNVCGESPAVEGSRRTALRVAAAAGAFLIPAFHELFGLCLIVILLLGAIVLFLDRRREAVPWLGCAGLATLGLTLVLAAPGNAIRGARFPSPNVMVAAKIAIVQILTFLPDWLLNVPLLSATIVFALHPSIRALQPDWVKRFAGWRKWLLPATTAGLVAVGFYAPIYATSWPAQVRTITGLYLVFLIGWFVSVFVFTRRSTAVEKAHRTTRVLITASLVAFACSVVAHGNTRRALYDIRTTANTWHSALKSRYRALQSPHPDTNIVFVARAPRAPELFYGEDISETSANSGIANWRNLCVAGYFHVKAVALLPK